MAKTDSKEVCVNCKFWEYTGHAGECHRYPTAIVKYQTHWCGEYLSSLSDCTDLSPAPAGDFLSLPVVDVMTPEKKKPGRPKRVQQ